MEESGRQDRPRCPMHFDLGSPEQREDPFPVYASARAEQPVFYDEVHDLWVITAHDDVVTAVTDWETFSSEGALKSSRGDFPPEVKEVLATGWPDMPIIIDSDPPVHRALRSLINRAFTPRRVAGMRPRIHRLAHGLLDEIVDGGRADIIAAFAWPLPLMTIGDMMGLPRGDLERLHHLSQSWLMLMQDAPIERRRAYATDYVELQRYFVDVVEQRSRQPGDDLVSALILSAREGATDEEGHEVTAADIAGIPLDLLAAAHVTVTRVLGSALVRLLEQPDTLARVRADRDLLPITIEEILRMDSPAQGLFRTVTRDTELSGVRIPAGARVMVSFGSANRDEGRFAEPDAFRPERDDRRHHVAFGKGIHFCVGAPLARLELEVALGALLDRLGEFRLAAGGARERDPVFFARGFARLDLEWDAGATTPGNRRTD